MYMCMYMYICTSHFLLLSDTCRMADAVRRMQLRLNNVQYANCDVRITQGLEKWLAASRSCKNTFHVGTLAIAYPPPPLQKAL